MFAGMKTGTIRRLLAAFLFAFVFAQTMDVAIADADHPQAQDAHSILDIDLDNKIDPSDDIHCGCHNFHHLNFTVMRLAAEVYADTNFDPNSFQTPFETSLSPPVPPPLA